MYLILYGLPFCRTYYIWNNNAHKKEVFLCYKSEKKNMSAGTDTFRDFNQDIICGLSWFKSS